MPKYRITDSAGKSFTVKSSEALSDAELEELSGPATTPSMMESIGGTIKDAAKVVFEAPRLSQPTAPTPVQPPDFVQQIVQEGATAPALVSQGTQMPGFTDPHAGEGAFKALQTLTRPVWQPAAAALKSTLTAAGGIAAHPLAKEEFKDQWIGGLTKAIDYIQSVEDKMKLDPSIEGTTGFQIVNGVSQLLPYMALGAPGAVAIMGNSLNSALERDKQGIDYSTNMKLTVKDLLQTGAILKVPAAMSYAGAILKGGTYGAGVNLAGTQAEKAILRGGGYDKEADAIPNVDPVGLSFESAMGAAFSAMGSKGNVSRVKLAADMERMRKVKGTSATEFYKDITPEEKKFINIALKNMGGKYDVDRMIRNELPPIDPKPKSKILPENLGEGTKYDPNAINVVPGSPDISIKPGATPFTEPTMKQVKLQSNISKEVPTKPLTMKQESLQETGDKEPPKDTTGQTMGFFGNFALNHPRTAGMFRGVQEFFSPGSTMPDYKKWLILRHNSKGMSERGEKLADSFIKRYNYLNDQQRELLWDWMNQTPKEMKSPMEVLSMGQNPDLGINPTVPKVSFQDLPPELRPVALRFRTIDNILGKMLVNEGLISQETYEANKGKHIKYIYDIYLRENRMGAGINTKAHKARENMTDDMREAIGIVKDPVSALVQSIVETTRNVGMARYDAKIAEHPDWVLPSSVITVNMPNGTRQNVGIGKLKAKIELYDKIGVDKLSQPEQMVRQAYMDALSKAERGMSGVKTNGYIQLNGSKYGAMDGMYVRKAIATDLMPLWSISHKGIDTMTDAVRDVFATAGSYWKMKNVAVNLTPMVRNAVFSNLIQMNITGTPIHEILNPNNGLLVRAFKSAKNKDWVYNAALRKGLFKTNWSESELNDLLELSRNWKSDNLANIVESVMKLGKFYGKIDDFWKLAKVHEMIGKGSNMDVAALEANRVVMDYSLASPFIKTLRNIPMGSPYITYTYKSIPLIAEAMSTPAGVLRTGKWFVIPWLLQQYVTRDMTDEQVKKHLDSLDDYVKDGQVLIIPVGKGYEVMDVSYLTPMGNVYKMLTPAFKAIQGKNFDINAFARATGIGTGLLPTISYAILTGKDLFTNKDIVSEIGKYDDRTRYAELTSYIWKVAMPSMLTEYGPFAKIYEHEMYGKNKQGLPTSDTTYGRLAGINMYPLNPKGKQLNQVRDMKAVIKEVTKKIIEAERQGRRDDAVKLREILKRSTKEIFKKEEALPPPLYQPEKQED